MLVSKMPIQFKCPECKKVLKVSSKHAGKRGKCPHCEVVFRVPMPPIVAQDPPKLTDSNKPVSKSVFKPAPPRTAPKPKDVQPTNVDSPQDDFLSGLNEDDLENYTGAATPLKNQSQIVQEEDWCDTYSLSQSLEDSAAPPLPQLNPIQKKKKKKKPSAHISQSNFVPRTPWKDMLIFLFGIAMIPLAISIFSEDDPITERLSETFGEDTVAIIEKVEASADPDGALNKILDETPGHKLVGAHLAYDTWMHWAYAFLTAGIFTGLLIYLSNGEVSWGKILIYGVITGTVGIILLLGFQWVAFFTQGFWVRGRGIVVLLFYLVKFIGFSYNCALDPNNGFALSFLGFTCGVGLCEELVKAVPIVFYLKDFEKPTWRGAFMIGLASGIGFGISEGINYSSAHYNGYAGGLIYIVRFASCVSLHAIWSGTVAMLMFRNESRITPTGEEPDMLMFLINYLLAVMILHGLYDTLLKKDMPVGALAIAGISLLWMTILFYKGRFEFEAEPA